jgi:hypothetical protein
MKKISFYSKTSIFVYSVLLTGVIGALMLSYNLRKAGKDRFVFPLVLFTLLSNVLLHLIIKSFYRPQYGRTWNLNMTIGWDRNISNYIWGIGDIYQFFLPNIILGFLLVSFVWKKQLSGFQTYEQKKPWIPFVATVVLYTGLFITLLIFVR